MRRYSPQPLKLCVEAGWARRTARAWPGFQKDLAVCRRGWCRHPRGLPLRRQFSAEDRPHPFVIFPRSS